MSAQPSVAELLMAAHRRAGDKAVEAAAGQDFIQAMKWHAVCVELTDIIGRANELTVEAALVPVIP